jgi:hypothetical protein
MREMETDVKMLENHQELGLPETARGTGINQTVPE